MDDERLTGHVPCSAPCMTINITAVGGKHDGKVIGESTVIKAGMHESMTGHNRDSRPTLTF